MSKQLNYTGAMSLNTSQIVQALKGVNASLKESTAQLNYFKEAGKSSSEIIDAYSQKIKAHSEKVELLSKKYEELKAKYGENDVRVKNAKTALENEQTALAKTQNGLESYKNEIDKATKAQDTMCNSITPLKQVLIDLAETIANKAATALVNFTKETINTGKSFETSFANVKKVVDGTDDELKALENQIRQTAMERPVDANTLASLYQMGGQLGIARDDLKDFTNAMVDLQNTSNLTAEAGAEMIAQYANVTGLKSDDYARFASTLSYLGSTTATNEATIMELVSRISGAGKQVGLAHKDILALATAMGSVGISAEAGGSAISTIMSNIDMAVDKQNEDLTTWANTAKMSASEFATLWKTDVLGAMQQVINGMANTKEEGGSLNILLSDLGISNIRQLDTMKKLAGASELLTDCMAKANKEWGEAKFLTSATVDAYNTLDSRLIILQNTFKDMQISIYDNLREPLKEATTDLTNFLKTDTAKQFQTEFSNIISQITNEAVKAIKWIITNFDGIVKAVQSVIPILSTFIKSFLTIKAIQIGQNAIQSFMTLKNAIVTATTAQNGLNTAMKANMIGLVVTAIWGLIEGLTALDNWLNKDTIKLQEQTKALEENKNAIINTNAEREKTLSGIDTEYNKYDSLVQELKTLVDENGNVKKGYEDRVNAIIPLLQQATGTEIQLIDNQIVGYQNLMTTLDQVIAKKRMEAKINAYQGDYEEAIRNESEATDKFNEIYDKRQELLMKMQEMEQNGTAGKHYAGFNGVDNTGYFEESKEYSKLKEQAEEYSKQINNLKDIKNASNETITKYESLVKEQYEQQLEIDTKAQEEYQKKLDEVKNKNNSSAITTQNTTQNKTTTTVTPSATVDTSAQTSSSKKTTEQSATTYNELLNQQKAYKQQLTNYVNEMKNGNSAVTVEMVQDTQKNLTAVEKKIKSLSELMGESVSDITNKANTAYNEIANLKTDNDDEIAEDNELDNENHISSGVIFGKGVLGDNAVEMQGGKDAATAYLEGYKAQQLAQQEAMNEAINTQAMQRANMESLTYQTATLDPENIAKYQLVERQVAEQKDLAQAQGLTDYSYLVSNASMTVMNLAKQAAMTIDFTSIGLYICQGIVRGIEANKGMVIDAVRAMMEEANSAAEDTEDIGSPSKVFYRYGKWIDMGLANGIKEYADDVSNQVRTMATNLQSSVDGITSNISSAKLNTDTNTLSGSGANTINYNFTQNNTTAKSLDTLAIYQESKSMLKRAIRNVYV